GVVGHLPLLRRRPRGAGSRERVGAGATRGVVGGRGRAANPDAAEAHAAGRGAGERHTPGPGGRCRARRAAAHVEPVAGAYPPGLKDRAGRSPRYQSGAKRQARSRGLTARAAETQRLSAERLTANDRPPILPLTMTDTNGHTGPLAGVRIVEFSEIIAGPFGGMLLADMGADVIKVEPPTGEPWRGFQPLGLREGRGYISLNRGKRGITLDLNTPEARAVAHELARRADVIIINYRPDVAKKLGIDYETLSRENPRLIYCDNTAFGRKGPYAHRPGYDIIAQALTGLMSCEGRREESGVPLLNAIPSADLSTGLAIAWSVCAALYARERTGRGQMIATSLMASALAIQNTRLMSIEATDTERREAALAKVNELRQRGAPYKEQLETMAGVRPVIGNIYYRVFQTADGFLAVGCLSTPLRKKLLAATG